jgi:hypothetical protein
MQPRVVCLHRCRPAALHQLSMTGQLAAKSSNGIGTWTRIHESLKHKLYLRTAADMWQKSSKCSSARPTCFVSHTLPRCSLEHAAAGGLPALLLPTALHQLRRRGQLCTPALGCCCCCCQPHCEWTPRHDQLDLGSCRTRGYNQQYMISIDPLEQRLLRLSNLAGLCLSHWSSNRCTSMLSCHHYVTTARLHLLATGQVGCDWQHSQVTRSLQMVRCKSQHSRHSSWGCLIFGG